MLSVRVIAANGELDLEVEGLRATVRADRPDGINAGDRVVIVLRPEKLTVSDTPVDAASGLNGVTARVEEVVYMGQTAQVFARAADGARLLARTPNTMRIPAPNEEIHLTWRKEHTRIVQP